MKPKLIKAYDIEFEEQEWIGENTSGCEPLGDRVLVLCDKALSQTSGGIFITDEMRDRLDQSAISGTVVAVGEDAFAWNSDRTRPWGVGRRPVAGDRVYFEKFAGLFFPASDDKQYRLMDDKCLGAFLV